MSDSMINEHSAQKLLYLVCYVIWYTILLKPNFIKVLIFTSAHEMVVILNVIFENKNGPMIPLVEPQIQQYEWIFVFPIYVYVSVVKRRNTLSQFLSFCRRALAKFEIVRLNKKAKIPWSITS